MRRLGWQSLALCSIGAGTAGIFVPLLPTTPFLLLAAWAASRSSPELHRWLHEHPHFGSYLRAWREERAIPRRAKCVSISLFLFSWIWLWMLKVPPLLLWSTAFLFSGLGGFLLSRPEPKGDRFRD
ncbi:DUF454 domain-containing protein [Proteobacteria bacterium 005FR1]|nr:DUF454 domain-containing protein [Proteobacteria bacterium 005FR1]